MRGLYHVAEPPAVCGALWAFLGAGRPLHRGLVLKSWSGTSSMAGDPPPAPGHCCPSVCTHGSLWGHGGEHGVHHHPQHRVGGGFIPAAPSRVGRAAVRPCCSCRRWGGLDPPASAGSGAGQGAPSAGHQRQELRLRGHRVWVHCRLTQPWAEPCRGLQRHRGRATSVLGGGTAAAGPPVPAGEPPAPLGPRCL